MRCHRITAGFLAAIAFVGTMGLGTAQASAEPSRESVRATRAAHVVEAPPAWVHRGKYWTRGGCLEAGQEGVQRHHWDEFQCANGSFWNLWTNR